ncbi:alpha/beta hydrolase [Leptospira sp. WS39.C2]
MKTKISRTKKPKLQNNHKEENLNSSGTNLHLKIWHGKKIPIICLHGLSGNLHSMESFAKLLNQKGHKVITYDLRGRGDSDKPINGYGFQNHVSDLNNIILHYNLKEVILLGHSFGCMIALRYVLLFPKQVKRMILLDGGGLLSIKKRIQILKVLKQSFDRLDVLFNTKNEYIEMVKNSPLIPKWTKTIESYFTKELRKTEIGYVCHMPKYVMEEELKEMGGAITLKNVFYQLILHPIKVGKKMIQNKRFDFENINVPTFIARAMNQNLFPNDDLLPKESFAEMLSRIPNAKGVELNTNHYGILFDELKERDESILKFINEK